MPELQIELEEQPQGLVARVSGEAGALAVGELERELAKISVRRPKYVVLDLSGLGFISSLGLGTLMTFRRAIERSQGQVSLAAATEEVRGVLTSSRMDQVFRLYDGVEQALAASRAENPA